MENEKIPGIEDIDVVGAENGIEVTATGVGKEVGAAITVTAIDVGNLKLGKD